MVVDQHAGTVARTSTASFDRTPPQHLEAEQAVLGAALLSRAALAEVVEILRPDDFYRSTHRSLYETVLELFARGEVIDPITVVDKLARTGKLDEIGGASAIHDLVATVPTAANAVYYARIVREKAILRRLIEAGTQVVSLGYEGGDDVNLTIDRAEQVIYDVAQGRVSSEFSVLKELLSEGFARIEQRFENRSEVTGLPTGFNDLDRLTAGLQPQNLIIIAARPAVGKCLAGSTRVVDPKTGALIRLDRLVDHAGGYADTHTLSLGPSLKLHPTEPAEFLDNGVQPTFVLRTRLGREIRATANHPLLTPAGWRPLARLQPGDQVAVPRMLDVFGSDELPDAEVALLGYLLGSGGCVEPVPTLTTESGRVASDAASYAAHLDALLVPSSPVTVARRYRFRARPEASVGHDPIPHRLTAMLRRHGVLGCRRDRTFVPDAIFRAPRRQVTLFLSRLLATSGRVQVRGGQPRVRMSSTSLALARDVQHLLLRFGLHACLRARTATGGRGRCALVIDDARQVVQFCREIGIFAQEQECAAAVRVLTSSHGTPGRVHAGGVHDAAARAGGPAGVEADVAWDAVMTIEPQGAERVYDLVVPGAHNFVADDLVVHNSSLSLGIAQYVTVELRRPAIVFSLEMSKSEIVDRVLASESNVNATKIRTGRLDDPDWAALSDAIGRLAEAPLFIDDTPSITLMEIRAKCRRLKQRHGLDLVVVDYLQLMQSHRRPDNRQQEVSEISRGLKMLAKELDLPVIALSQLSRQPETRTDKRPQLADLRESGCLTADTRILRADTLTPVTLGQLYRRGARDLPVWTVEGCGRLVRGSMTHVFASGVKPVYQLRLASGHEVTASANHPFLTVAGWKRLDELHAGERVAVATAPEPATAPSPPRWEAVMSVEPRGVRAVFDATVPGTHNFVANGIIAHNSIEQDSDVVAFIYRDELYDPDSPQRGTAELNVAKHRNGPTGVVRLAFLDHLTKFANLARTPA